MKEIIEQAKKLNGKEVGLKLGINLERWVEVGFCDDCLLKTLGRKDMLRPELLLMSEKVVEADSEISYLLLYKECFRCGNCAFEFIKKLRAGEDGVIIKNPKALDRLEEELKKYLK